MNSKKSKNFLVLRRGLLLLSSQIGAQVFAMAGIFLCIKFLKKDDFGLYVAITSFQSILSIIIDLQTSSALTALGPKKIHKLGDIIYICGKIRRKNLVFIFLASAIIFYFLINNQFYIEQKKIALIFLLLIFSSWFQQEIAINYQILAVVGKNELVAYYQLAHSFFRFSFILIALYFFGIVECVLFAGAVAVFWGAVFLNKRSVQFYKKANWVDFSIEKEIKNFIRPMILPTIVFAVQGNLWVMLVGGGEAPKILAEIGALSRFAQIFPIFSALNNTLILPVLAKYHLKEKSKIIIFYCLLVASAFALCVVFISYYFSESILKLIGASYIYLDKELLLVFSSAGATYLSGVFYMILLSRSDTNFQYLSVPVTVFFQMYWYFAFGLDSAYNVAGFMLVTSLAALIFQALLLSRSLIVNR